MIYLKNTTSGQTVFISREGSISATTGHSSSWEEGFESGRTFQRSLLSSATFTENDTYANRDGWSSVTVDVDVESAYQDGYIDGRAFQKSLLSNLTVTENGRYSDEDGFAEVEVLVDTEGAWHNGYVSGVTDGEIIGIASGITYQRGLLSSITITANTSITRTDGWSAVTVNVPQSGMSGTEIPLTGNTYSADTYGRYYFDYDPTDPISSITVYFTVQPEPPYQGQYFTTRSLSNNNRITANIGSGITSATSLSVSTDSGQTWQTATVDGTNKQLYVTLQSGQTAIWKGTAVSWYGDNYLRFSSYDNYEVEGNIMSLVYNDSYADKYTIPGTGCFRNLFYNSVYLKSAENLLLPATGLVERCYQGLFFNCSGLTTPPVLTASVLAPHCYEDMFNGCESLTTAPLLHSVSLANYCYETMFRNCKSLVDAPSLPATELAQGCYFGMFVGCTGITTAPELNATALVKSCYHTMFSGCSHLNSITCLAMDMSAEQSTENWVLGVSSTGTFTKSDGISWPTGNDGIPTNWTVQDAS